MPHEKTFDEKRTTTAEKVVNYFMRYTEMSLYCVHANCVQKPNIITFR